MKGVFEEVALNIKSILNQSNSISNSINDHTLTVHQFKQGVAQRSANIKTESENILH